MENKLYILHQHYNQPTAQSAGIRAVFLAYSCDLMRQRTARWREKRWCKEDAFQASREGYSMWARVCVLRIGFYLLNLSQLNEVLHPIASVTSHSCFDLLCLFLLLCNHAFCCCLTVFLLLSCGVISSLLFSSVVSLLVISICFCLFAPFEIWCFLKKIKACNHLH